MTKHLELSQRPYIVSTNMDPPLLPPRFRTNGFCHILRPCGGSVDNVLQSLFEKRGQKSQAGRGVDSAFDHFHKEETIEAGREGETKMGECSRFT